MSLADFLWVQELLCSGYLQFLHAIMVGKKEFRDLINIRLSIDGNTKKFIIGLANNIKSKTIKGIKSAPRPKDEVERLPTDPKKLNPGDVYISPEGKKRFINELKKEQENVLKEQKTWFEKYDMRIKGFHIESVKKKAIID